MPVLLNSPTTQGADPGPKQELWERGHVETVSVTLLTVSLEGVTILQADTREK